MTARSSSTEKKPTKELMIMLVVLHVLVVLVVLVVVLLAVDVLVVHDICTGSTRWCWCSLIFNVITKVKSTSL